MVPSEGPVKAFRPLRCRSQTIPAVRALTNNQPCQGACLDCRDLILGYLWLLYRDNGKENGNYYLGFRVLGFGFPEIRGTFLVTIMENQMEKKMENEMETGIYIGDYRV